MQLTECKWSVGRKIPLPLRLVKPCAGRWWRCRRRAGRCRGGRGSRACSSGRARNCSRRVSLPSAVPPPRPPRPTCCSCCARCSRSSWPPRPAPARRAPLSAAGCPSMMRLFQHSTTGEQPQHDPLLRAEVVNCRRCPSISACDIPVILNCGQLSGQLNCRSPREWAVFSLSRDT